MTLFFLGVHEPAWLPRTDVPLFVSRRRLARRAGMPRARGPWALDSGGFTELSLHGRWTLPAADYVRDVRRYVSEVGNLQWAAPQDWMCEPIMLKRTGLSVLQHQRRTIANFLELRDLASELPIIPVLQGWAADDYRRCIERYAKAGVDLEAQPLVGLGTVCRRQATADAVAIVRTVRAELPKVRLHGFGFKTKGLAILGRELASADSMSWSLHARKRPPLPEHAGRHLSCANCLEYAVQWRERLLAA